MGTVLRTKKDIPLDALKGIDIMFGREMKFDVDNVPKKFKPMFDITRSASFSLLKLRGIYESFEIRSITDKQIQLETGEVLESEMYARVFAKSSELVFYAVSVEGYDELENGEQDMLGKVFLDSWGTAIVESGYAWVRKYVRENLKKQGVYSTTSFSPGQHGVPMEIQNVIFSKLLPEEIGITLNSHFLMQPQKSVSGVFGIGKEENDNNLRPCDFCERNKTCPNAYAENFMYG